MQICEVAVGDLGKSSVAKIFRIFAVVRGRETRTSMVSETLARTLFTHTIVFYENLLY